MRKRWPVVIVIISVIVVAVILAMVLNSPKPFPEVAGIVAEDWEFSTYLGGTMYNETVYGYPALVFNVSSADGSQVYMLSRNDTRLPMTSSSLLRSSISSCKIDWGWLGLGNNYAFLTWNGTCWKADTDDGSESPETTIINGYDPSADWRNLTIVATSADIKYYIDEQLVAMHSSRIPAGDFQFYGEFDSTGTASKLYIASHRF